MALRIDLQNNDAIAALPAPQQFERWVGAALQQTYNALEQTIRVVGEGESRCLNARYRGRDQATNVLAFPAEFEHLEYDCLGDLVICAPLVATEASAQDKSIEAHWAHLVIHGMLHLQGFDHCSDADSERMETMEIKILDSLGYANPYND